MTQRESRQETRASYRQGVEEHSQEEQQDEQDQQTYDDPLEPAPHDEAHGLAWVGEPEEGGFWSAAVQRNGITSPTWGKVLSLISAYNTG